LELETPFASFQPTQCSEHNFSSLQVNVLKQPGSSVKSQTSSLRKGDVDILNEGTFCFNVQEQESSGLMDVSKQPSFLSKVVSSFDPIEEVGGSKAGTGVYLGGRYSVDDIVAFGGISSPRLDARSSERIRLQENADDTQLERAQKLAKAKDIPSYSGTNMTSKFSLSSIPNDVFLQRAKILGVSLGASPSQAAKSIASIKEVDNHRTLIMIQKNLDEVKKSEEPNNNDDSFHNEVLEHASSISLDIGDDAQLAPEKKEPIQEAKKFKVYTRREKVVPKVVRRSVRLSKKYKPSN
jgi:hypothetical protein